MAFRRTLFLHFVSLALGLLGSSIALSDTAQVDINGLDDELTGNVKAFLSIRSRIKAPKVALLDKIKGEVDPQAGWSPPSAAEIRRLHGLATAEIEQALQPYGYYHPLINAELEELKPGEWFASYTVTKGPRSVWREVAVSVTGAGADQPLVAELKRRFVVQPNQTVDHARYDEFKGIWLSRFYGLGFLNARFTNSVLEVDLAAERVDLRWEFDTGPQFYFGDLTIDQDVLRPDLVARYHSIQPGEPFSTERLIDLQLELTNSNYFNSVRLDIRRDEAVDQRVPVTVLTEPRDRRRTEIGIGYGTDTGPRLSAGLTNRRVNDRGHRYRVNGRISQVESELQFEYDIPIKNVARDRWRLYAQVEKGDVGDADATAYSTGVAREDSWWKLRRRVFLNLEHSNFRFGDEPSQSATLLYPGINLSYDVLDNPQFVRRGYSLAATLQGGTESLGSETDFAALYLSGRGIVPLGKQGRIISALDVRVVEAKDFSALPPSQRLFLGGDRSLRGYGFESVSPENAAGDDIGGPYSLSGSIEVDYRVRGPWRVAAFVDAGNVANSFPNQFQQAVGVGLRYQSPVGMIRLDLAHPLDDPDTNIRLHISIGPDL